MENWITQTEGKRVWSGGLWSLPCIPNIECVFDCDPKTVQSKVEIDPAMQRDAGYYECQAYNKHAVETKVGRATSDPTSSSDLE